MSKKLPKIDSLTIKGFKSIKNLDKLQLNNLNILIGANGAGKSNFISYFRMLNEMIPYDRKTLIGGSNPRLQFYVAQQGGSDRLLSYGLDEEFPGKQQAKNITCGDIKIKFDTFITEFSKKLTSDLGYDAMSRVIPYVQMYEFESLLFSDSEILAKNLYTKKDKVDKILAEFDNDPERINNSFNTKPSKRIGELYNKKIDSPHSTTYYKKVEHGILIAKKIGSPKIVDRCSLFSNWMQEIKSRIPSENTKLQHQEIL
jgi:AAA15 family ATPase/GTPase